MTTKADIEIGHERAVGLNGAVGAERVIADFENRAAALATDLLHVGTHCGCPSAAINC